MCFTCMKSFNFPTTLIISLLQIRKLRHRWLTILSKVTQGGVHGRTENQTSAACSPPSWPLCSTSLVSSINISWLNKQMRQRVNKKGADLGDMLNLKYLEKAVRFSRINSDKLERSIQKLSGSIGSHL